SALKLNLNTEQERPGLRILAFVDSEHAAADLRIVARVSGERQQVLGSDIHAEVGDAQPVKDRVVLNAVSELHDLKPEVVAVLQVERRHTTKVSVWIIRRQARIVCRGIFARPPVQHRRRIVRVGDVKTPEALEDLVSTRAVGKHHEVEVAVSEIQGEAESIFRKARSEKRAVQVIGSDHAVTVDVYPPEVARPCIGLEQFSVGIAISIDLRFVLEYPISNVSEELVVRMTHLRTGYRTHVLEAGVAANEINVGRNISNLVLERSEITGRRKTYRTEVA